MQKNIWFDMDGTIADLYGVQGWLDMLHNENATPYEIAKPLCNMRQLARQLNKLTKKGYTINIITWLAPHISPTYRAKIINAKKQWLRTHLKSVQFTNIDILEYGTPKQVNRSGILFDDEPNNRNTWNGKAYNVNDIIGVLKSL